MDTSLANMDVDHPHNSTSSFAVPEECLEPSRFRGVHGIQALEPQSFIGSDPGSPMEQDLPHLINSFSPPAGSPSLPMTFVNENVPASLTFTETSQDLSIPQRPKRGRLPKPKIQSEQVLRRPPGRPRGSGPKQKAKAAQLNGSGDYSGEKRPVGRPKKSSSEDASQRLVVKVKELKQKILVPSVSSKLTRSASTPSSIHQKPNGHPASSFFKKIGEYRASSAPLVGASISVPGGHSPKPSSIHPTPEPPNDNSESETCNSELCDIAIIPPADPQRPVDLDDDDDCPDLLEDGIGLEDDADSDVDDEIEQITDNSMGHSTKSPKHRRPMPIWLCEEFSAKVAESAIRNEDGLPALYAKHHTIWFPHPTTAFLLRRQHLHPEHIYNHRFALWDPSPLTPNGIPCPNCGVRLYRLSHISRPRRIVDFNQTFYIIGYRYRCSSCVNPSTGKRGTLTFRSWDNRVLAKLPPEIAAEFPARLSHRSGMSKGLSEWMRSCFQNGMGAKQFSDALRVQHTLKYAELELQYLDAVVLRKQLHGWRHIEYDAFLPFEDTSPRGYHGFVPSAQWIRDMYDRYIEEHQSEINQHTAMLSAEICALDHSHKITKHIAKVDGEPVFTALLTVTNQLGEIRSCNLVATKSHAQFEQALKETRRSLEVYGHLQPTLFFTDNMSDKQFLEQCFPSLLESVDPVEKYQNLDPLVVPLGAGTQIFVKKSTSAINDAMSTIINDLHPNSNKKLVVGFDSEWNVEVAQNGNVIQRGKTAVIQIAYKDRIYILQVADMIASGQLPHQLQILLSHPDILKAGRLVNADLKYLEAACHRPPRPFLGALDLAKYAKDRRVISSANCSLADLCAIVLNKRLNKNVPERVSTAWENENLTHNQLMYAACDAYACLSIYNKLSEINVPRLLNKHPLPGTPVLLYSSDNTTVIAQGNISAQNNNNSKSFDGISITRAKILIDVHKILVPGAILTTHRNRSLQSFGSQLPFSVVCLQSHLREFSPASWLTTPSNKVASTPGPLNTTTSDTDDLVIENRESESLNESDSLFESTLHEDPMSAEPSLGDIVTDNSRVANLSIPTAQEYHPDAASAALGAESLGLLPDKWDHTIRSRVIKDCFHVFNMLRLPSAHGLRLEFGRMLRDAIFIPDEDDKRRICAWGTTQSPPLTFEQIRASHPQWLWRRCRRTIPPPKILYPLVDRIFRDYGPLKDAATGTPLFNANNWTIARNILDLIRNGFLSDPPGISLYTTIGIDHKAGGLPIYRCARGTNFTEGGVHSHLRSHMPSSGASIRHTQSCLLDFVLRHNLLVGTFNSTGQRYRGHFSIWTTNKIQERLTFLQESLVNPIKITGWVNGNLFVPTTEQLGILPIPSDVQSESGMTEFVLSLDGQQKHGFLAQRQGTHKPVLPIHTSTEKELFQYLMQSNVEFSRERGPNWKTAVKVWNCYANINAEVSYKLTEQLKTYYATWKSRLNVKESMSLTYPVRQPIAKLVQDPVRSQAVPQLSKKKCQPRVVTNGLRAETSASHAAESHQPANPANFQVVADQIASDRVTTDISMTDVTVKTRNGRSCRRCAQPDCKGKKGVDLCFNPCQDCGNVDCSGRNPRRPTRTCATAWDKK